MNMKVCNPIYVPRDMLAELDCVRVAGYKPRVTAHLRLTLPLETVIPPGQQHHMSIRPV